jgi:hypothetical protein
MPFTMMIVFEVNDGWMIAEMILEGEPFAFRLLPCERYNKAG